MNQPILNWISKFFKFALLSVAILYIIKYLFVVYSRINFPFELEWIEGDVLNQVRRVLSGELLYVKPSLDFIPYNYAPLYFYVSAAVSSIMGIGFLPLRLVSFVSSLGCFYIIYLIVYKETGSKYSGILSVCLFAASFPLSGGWFDVGRLDSLYLVFLLIAVYLIKFTTSNKMYILAGIFMSLSFFTKQTALVISLPIMLYCLLYNWRKSFYFNSTILITVLGVSLILNYIHDGWFYYYVFKLSQHPLQKNMFIHFWKKDILAPVSIAWIMSIFFLLAQLLEKNKNNFLFYSLVFVGMVGGACLNRTHAGSGQNVVMPAYAIMSILSGMAFHVFFEFIRILPENRKYVLRILFCLVFLLQFSLEPIRYSTAAYIPPKKDMEAGMKLVETIKQMEGEVFIPDFGYLAIMAGKKSYAHGMAIRDILYMDKGEVRNNLLSQINQAIQEKKFSAIIVSLNNGVKDLGPGLKNIEKYYKIQKIIFESEDVFWPVCGLGIRPEFIYVPKE